MKRIEDRPRGRIAHYWDLYKEFFRLRVREKMIYRGSYFAGIVGQWIGYGVRFASIFIVVSAFQTLAGWTATEVLFLYSLELLSYALAACLFFNLSSDLAGKIQSGAFDQTLTKPLHPLLYEIGMGFNTGYLSHLILSLGILLFAAARMGVRWTPGKVACLVLFVLSAALIQGSFLLLGASAAFVTVGGNPLISLMFQVLDFVRYPINIYHVVLQVLLTFLLPVAFINFYPAAALLGKQYEGLGAPWWGYFAPVVGVLLFGVSLAVWTQCLARYQSSGT